MNTLTMQRLPFRLHDFTRYAWVSDHAKDAWQPRIHRITACRHEIERRAVAAGLQPCMLQVVPPEQLTAQSHDLAQHDLVVLPLDRVRSQGTAYHTVLAGAKPAEPFHWRVVIGSTQNVEEFKAAWDANDQRRVRTLLGYPACCRDFFEEVWVKEKFIDTTWPMACNTQAKKEIDSHIVEVDGPVQANVLLRWLGVRAVSHLPCRFDCSATIEQANRSLAVARDAGYAEEISWLLEILDWPTEWSVLHGIAEIKTPVLKIMTVSDATAQKYVVRRMGHIYPQEGIHGLAFPYRQPARLRITDSRNFQRGLAHSMKHHEKDQKLN